ncbi:MAG: hypothetical protein ACOZFS_02170 [Thermodesulfobacteriota bacterium]
MRKLLCLVAALSFAFSSSAFAQKLVPDPNAGAKIRAATQPITLVARIGYSSKHGGYYVMNNPERQSGNKTILNQNYKILKSLHKRGRAVTIRGRVDPLNFLATHIVIDRIDGRPYQGTHAPLVPLP